MPRRFNLHHVAPTVLLALSLGACDKDGDTGPTQPQPSSELGEMGAAIYRDVVEDGNSFTCATCHALTEPADDFRRPGHSLGDAAGRPSYKNGELTQMRDAVNSCLSEWMNAEPWTADDTRWLALEAFLTEISPETAAALRFEILEAPLPVTLEGGDATRGQAVFNASCAVCHGDDGMGSTQGPPVAGRAISADLVGRRVRTSGRADSEVYTGLTGGVMPFWAADRLSEAELVDIVAWLSQDTASADDGMDDSADDGMDDSADDSPDDGMDDSTDDSTDDGMDDGGPTGCTSAHPKVGQTAVLTEAFHDVGGTAEIMDDCTIRITDFTYDASGIDVRLYGGLGGDYDSGFAIGDDLVRATPYAGETIDFRLPEGMTMDDLDGVSVWCVDVGIDFGSGSFE